MTLSPELESLAKCEQYRDELCPALDLVVHQREVGIISGILARQIGLDAAEADLIEAGARFHDIGKLVVPERILCKPTRLSTEERRAIHRHTELGYGLLSSVNDPVGRMAAEIALHHHEAMDGSGYPHGLSGTDISLPARIVAVADVFSALTQVRPYKAAMTAADAVDLMYAGDDQIWPEKFDPKILGALTECIEQLAGFRAMPELRICA